MDEVTLVVNNSHIEANKIRELIAHQKTEETQKLQDEEDVRKNIRE